LGNRRRCRERDIDVHAALTAEISGVVFDSIGAQPLGRGATIPLNQLSHCPFCMVQGGRVTKVAGMHRTKIGDLQCR
jgi:hypothetical protein